jgi:hypothetical protein
MFLKTASLRSDSSPSPGHLFAIARAAVRLPSESLFAITGICTQVGAVFIINGKVAGMDCFGRSETFTKVFKKLVESYALDAIDSLGKYDEKALRVSKTDAGKFMEAASGWRMEAHQSVGLGTDCRLDSDQSAGFALAHEDQILHMSLFAKTAESNTEFPGSRMIRFSHRRRRRF